MADPGFDQGPEAVTGVGQLVRSAGELVQVCAVLGQCGLDQLVLGLEVVVDVSDGNVGRPRDAGEGGPFDALFVQDLGCRGGEPSVLVGRPCSPALR